MSKKRQNSSSIVSIMDDENLDLHDIEDDTLSADSDSVNYMNMDISTDNIEDIVLKRLKIKQRLKIYT